MSSHLCLRWKCFQNSSPIFSFLGLLILNLVCRNKALEQSLLNNMSAVFPALLHCKLADDINQIVFAGPPSLKDNFDDDFVHGRLPAALEKDLKYLNGYLQEKHGRLMSPNLRDKLDMLKPVIL